MMEQKKMSKYQDFIQPFLDGELSREELDWISKELESNAVLADDIKLYREVDHAIREQDVLDLRDKLEVVHNSMDERVTNPKNVPRYRKVISYAAIASLAILISFGVLYKIQNRKLSNMEIYEKYYEPYDVTMVYRSSGENTGKLFQEAMVKYEQSQFRDATVLFEQLLKTDPGDMASTLYSGISYMEVDQYQKADQSFNKIIVQNDNLFIEQAGWYLGFCYLMTNELDKARKHFEKIAASNSSYNEKASEIVKRLK
jgi:tetratricopeptide (TPR) repeat protein